MIVGHVRWFRTSSHYFACSRLLKGRRACVRGSRIDPGQCQKQRRVLLRRNCR